MSSAISTEPRLRVSAIPQMVDVDGHIDEQLLRSGQGVTVRPMFQAIPIDDFEWSPDDYSWSAADEWLPQPPWALDGWELELYGVNARTRSSMPCGCPSCTHMYRWLDNASQAPPREPFRAAPGRIWFLPTVEDVNAPRRAELERAVLLNAVPQRIALGFDGSRLLDELERAQAALTQLERARDELTEFTRFRLDRLVPSKPAPPEIVREQALELRQNRNTGPVSEPFKHRGGRRGGRR